MMNLETIATVIVGLMIGVDLALLQRSNARLRKQLLELAAQTKTRSDHSITIDCDNRDALIKIGEVEAAAKRAAASLQHLEQRLSGLH